MGQYLSKTKFISGSLYRLKRDMTFGQKYKKFGNDRADLKENSHLLFLGTGKEPIVVDNIGDCFYFWFDNKIIYRYSNNTFADWFEELKINDV